MCVDEAAADTGNLAKPEFEGMWDQHKPYKVPKDVITGPKLPGATKMERVSEQGTGFSTGMNELYQSEMNGVVVHGHGLLLIRMLGCCVH